MSRRDIPRSTNSVHTVSAIGSAPVVAVDYNRARPTLVLVQPDPIRVVIADAEPAVRAGLTATVQAERDIAVAGYAADADEAVVLASELRPDVVLLALDLPGAGGLEAARRINEDPDSADVNVLILAPHDRDEDLFAALLAGAHGFVLKSAGSAELVRAVRVLAEGEAMLSPNATRRLIAAFRSGPKPELPSPEDAHATARRRLRAVPTHALAAG